MDNQERETLQAAIKLLDSWLHSGVTSKPRRLVLDAVQTAVDAMRKDQDSNYKRHCVVLQYHIDHPDAILFRDPVTLAAIKTGIAVMERRRLQQ